jgi:1-deoxy-D-xylulose-5-phosphate reductoisomerase
MIGITILGSTGTIGVNTLDVISRHPGRFRVFALTANRNAAALLEQCLQWRPAYAVMVEAPAAAELRTSLRVGNDSTRIIIGNAGNEARANPSQWMRFNSRPYFFNIHYSI